jgi:protein gp37
LPLFPEDYDYPLPNVGLIASAETQEEYDRRSFFLEKSRYAMRGYSFEPLLGPIKLDTKIHRPDWIAIGGETGGRQQEIRKTEKAWLSDLISQATKENIPVWFKSWGEYGENGLRIGRKASGNEIDGAYFDALPFADRAEAPSL